MIKNIRHTGLVVNNISKLKDFYLSLGFEIVNEDIEEGTFIDTLTGLKESKLHTVKMKTENSSMIELIKYLNPVSPIINQSAQPNSLGCSHFAMTVDNANEICELIKKNGGTEINPPAKNLNGTVKVAYCYDPEGILIEVVEEL